MRNFRNNLGDSHISCMHLSCKICATMIKLVCRSKELKSKKSKNVLFPLFFTMFKLLNNEITEESKMKNLNSIKNPSCDSVVEMYNSMEPDANISPYEAIRSLAALETVRQNPYLLKQITKEEGRPQ